MTYLITCGLVPGTCSGAVAVAVAVAVTQPGLRSGKALIQTL